MAKPGIEVRSSEFKLKCFVPELGLPLPVEPHFLSQPLVSVIRMMKRCASSFNITERPLCVPLVTGLSLLKSCDLELSTETHLLTDFPFDREKSVSCQDIWGGTDNTLSFPDVILSACVSHMELGEGCH